VDLVFMLVKFFWKFFNNHFLLESDFLSQVMIIIIFSFIAVLALNVDVASDDTISALLFIIDCPSN